MSITATIKGAGDEKRLEVRTATEFGGEANGVVALTEPLLRVRPTAQPALNQTYGQLMNINAAVGGTPVLVHDGTDTAAWTGSNIVGTSVTFNDTTRASAGTRSVYVNGPALSDTWQFDKGSSQALTGYEAITMNINVDRRWTTDSIELYGWDGSTEVGTRVALEDYFTASVYDTWHTLTIPLADMGLTGETITGFRMQFVAASGPAPEFWIDEFQIEETGGGEHYDVTAFNGNAYRVRTILITAVDALSGTVPNNLAYDQILGVSALANGIQITHVDDGVVNFQGSFQKLADFMAIGFSISEVVADGTDTCLTLRMDFPEPVIIKGEDTSNYLRFTVADDLSGLLSLSAMTRGDRVL